MDYKQIISEAVLANKSRKQTAAEMKISDTTLYDLSIKIWPDTRGKWTVLRETFGLSPRGHIKGNNPLTPSFRIDKIHQCSECGRYEWIGKTIPLNVSGQCLNCAAVMA